ncbi:MAG: hypothetical protein ACMUJM_12950 [bacterium]
MRKSMIITLVICSLCLSLIMGCSTFEKAQVKPRMTLFVGLDISSSFYNSPYYQDAIQFLSVYLYMHMQGIGGLKRPKNLFVSSIGAEDEEDPRAFRPIHDFENKTPDQIRANLLKWYPKSNSLTDFNVFFDKVASTVQKHNLVLAPTTILIISDGIHDMEGDIKERDEFYSHINLDPLEYLARNVTIRLLYTSPKVAEGWDRKIERRRVKIWTKEAEVMMGWHNQFVNDLPIIKQDKLVKWIQDNVNFRVRSKRL